MISEVAFGGVSGLAQMGRNTAPGADQGASLAGACRWTGVHMVRSSSASEPSMSMMSGDRRGGDGMRGRAEAKGRGGRPRICANA